MRYTARLSKTFELKHRHIKIFQKLVNDDLWWSLMILDIPFSWWSWNSIRRRRGPDAEVVTWLDSNLGGCSPVARLSFWRGHLKVHREHWENCWGSPLLKVHQGKIVEVRKKIPGAKNFQKKIPEGENQLGKKSWSLG